MADKKEIKEGSLREVLFTVSKYINRKWKIFLYTLVVLLIYFFTYYVAIYDKSQETNDQYVIKSIDSLQADAKLKQLEKIALGKPFNLYAKFKTKTYHVSSTYHYSPDEYRKPTIVLSKSECHIYI